MKRRDVITLLGELTAWPLATRARQPPIPVIEFMRARSPTESASDLAAFRHGLEQSGYFEGKNLAIEYRWAESGCMSDRLHWLRDWWRTKLR